MHAHYQAALAMRIIWPGRFVTRTSLLHPARATGFLAFKSAALWALPVHARDGPQQHTHGRTIKMSHHGVSGRPSGVEMQRLHLKCGFCPPVIANTGVTGVRSRVEPRNGGVWASSHNCLKVASELLSSPCGIRRCASNSIHLDGSLPNAATAYRRRIWLLLNHLDWSFVQFRVLDIEG
jgi:hypothetical protein